MHLITKLMTCFYSTFIDPDTRRAMGEQATALAKAVGYDSAGKFSCFIKSIWLLTSIFPDVSYFEIGLFVNNISDN